MAERLGPIDFTCDSPPYYIVRACTRVGIATPEDVRWCRMSRYLNPATGGVWPPWKAVVGLAAAGEKTCTCKRALPLLERCTFTLASGRQVSYYLGQCPGCHAVYWEEA